MYTISIWTIVSGITLRKQFYEIHTTLSNFGRLVALWFSTFMTLSVSLGISICLS